MLRVFDAVPIFSYLPLGDAIHLSATSHHFRYRYISLFRSSDEIGFSQLNKGSGCRIVLSREFWP